MSGESAYMVIYNDIVKKIRGGEWTEGEPLPAERSLCTIYHVSRTTARRALERLERDGYIIKRHGNGNFVKPQIYKQSLSRFYWLTDSLKKDGIIVKNEILDYRLCPADQDLSKTTLCEVGEVFHKLTRLRSARTYPLMVETTWLLKSRFAYIDLEWLRDNSLYDYLNERYDRNIERSTEIFSPVMPGRKERELLNISQNLPCMWVQRLNYEKDILIEYSTTVVRGDKFRFEAELAVSGNDCEIINRERLI